MNETRYDQLEARIATLEAEVARLMGAHSPAPAPAHVRVPVSLGRWPLFGAIALVVVLAVIGLGAAVGHGSLGAGIAVLIGLAIGLVLVLVAATRIPATDAAFAEALIALGAIVLEISIGSAATDIPAYQISRTAIFAGAIAIAALLGALAFVRQSERLGLLASACAFATPFLVGPVGAPPQLVQAIYTIVACGATLAFAMRFGFASLEIVAFLGVALNGWTLGPDAYSGWSIAAAQIASKLMLFELAIAYALGPHAENAAIRRGILIATSVAAYAFAVEFWLHGAQRVLGFDLIGLAAAMLVAALIRAWPKPITRAFAAAAAGSGVLAIVALGLSLTKR